MPFCRSENARSEELNLQLGNKSLNDDKRIAGIRLVCTVLDADIIPLESDETPTFSNKAR